jgi:hypothetical protein
VHRASSLARLCHRKRVAPRRWSGTWSLVGASFADYISKPRDISGINFGDGPTAIVFAVAVLVLVTYLAIARSDIQPPLGDRVTTQPSQTPMPDLRHEGETELDSE